MLATSTRWRSVCWAPLAIAAAIACVDARADAISPSRPATRAQSLAALSGGGALPVDCLTPLLQSLRQDPASGFKLSGARRTRSRR